MNPPVPSPGRRRPPSPPAAAPERIVARDDRIARLLMGLVDLRLSVWTGLLTATLLIAAAAGLRASLAPILGTHARLIFFCPIIMVCGWLWDLRVGFFATLLSLTLGNLFFLPSGLHTSLTDLHQAWAWENLAFILVGITLAALAQGAHALHIRVRDSERIAAEQSQRQAENLDRLVGERTSELAEAVEQLEAFSAGVAHDFRGPLRTICNYAEIIEAERGHELSAETRAMLARIMASAERLNQLMADLLDYSRISLGELTLVPIRLEETFASLIESHEELKKADLRIVHPLGTVRANAVGLDQILLNLLDNAIKFVRPGLSPQVKAWSERRDGVLRLWIEDNGIGIADDDVPHIFDVFERLHSHEKYPGTGIGLAMVRKAVHRMKGRVGVESEPGRGSRFWIELPAVD